MNVKIIISVCIALCTGAAIAMQSSLNGKAGAVIGSAGTIAADPRRIFGVLVMVPGVYLWYLRDIEVR